MTSYLVERYLPGITPDQLAAAAGSAKRTTATMAQEGTPVHYRRSTFLAGEDTCVCLFAGPSVDAVRTANDRAQLPYERIVEARHLASEDLHETCDVVQQRRPVMEANHFDSLVKAVGSAKSGASRRRVLRSFVAGTLAGLTALGGIGAPSARNKCKGAGKSCQSNAQCCSKICDETFTCVCAPEDQQCDRGCFSRFDANHCGACGVQCAESAGEVCQIPFFDPPGSPPRCCKLFGAPCTRDDPRNPINPGCCGGQCTIFGTCI